MKNFAPNIKRLKRKDSSQIGVKEDSHSHNRAKIVGGPGGNNHRGKMDSTKKNGQSSSNNNKNNNNNNNNNHQMINQNNNSGSNKSNFRMIVDKNNLDYSDESAHSQLRRVGSSNNVIVTNMATGGKSSSNTSNNTNGGGGCNDNCRLTISFQNKSAKFNKLVKNPFDVELGSVSSRFRSGACEVDDVRYGSSSKNFSSKIWSWISTSPNYSSVVDHHAPNHHVNHNDEDDDDDDEDDNLGTLKVERKFPNNNSKFNQTKSFYSLS